MNYRYLLLLFVSTIFVPQFLIADSSISASSEIERLKILEEKQLSAFQAYTVATEDRAIGPGSIRNYGDFMYAEIEPLFKTLYGNDFSDFDLESLSYQGLEARLKAFRIAGFFRNSGSILMHMLDIVDEMYTRGDVSQEIASRMFGDLIRARNFDAARTFSARFSDLPLEPVPEIIDPYAGDRSEGRKTVWQVSEDGSTLTRSEIRLKGPRIVVYASLSCAHSRRFMAELPGQEELSEIFGEHAVWIEPQDNDLQMQVVAAWNRQHPDQALQFMHAFAEWPEYEDWATPAFYFVENGKIKKSFTGWPNWNEVIDGVERIGLADPGEIMPPAEIVAE